MRPFPIFLFAVALVAMLALTGCGNSSTSPQMRGSPSFARMFGCTPSNNTAVIGDVVVTSDGNRVVAGTFSGGYLHVTGSPDSLAAGGGARVFVAAFQRDGSLAWKTTLAGGGEVTIRHMARDPDDNLLLAGSFDSNINVGGIPLTNAGNSDVFIMKLDKDAKPIWARAGSTTGPDIALDVAAGSDGSVYVAGVVGDLTTVAGLSVGESGNPSGFVAGIRSDGVGAWRGLAETASVSNCTGVAASEDGTVVVCGVYATTFVVFAGNTLAIDGGVDGFVGRFSASGVGMGSIHIGGAGDSNPESVITLNNDVIVTGSFSGDVDFDVTTAAGAVSSPGATHAFVARYSEAGALRWVKTFGAGEDQAGLSLDRIDSNHFLLCGVFSNSITLGSKTLTPSGASDAFIARLDGDGNVLSANQLGGADTEDTAFAAADGSTAIVVGLTISDEMFFPDGTHLKKLGLIDSFLYQQP